MFSTRRGAAMLPYLCPEMIEWLLTWSTQSEDRSSSEEKIAELSQDSIDNKTTGKQLQRRANHSKPLKWREY
jgi:hypothetical protein